MLFQMPSDDVLYQALLAKDPAYEGRVYVGVRSTGIFCRLSCSARKPKKENTVFFGSIPECLAAGFRPCRRCHPMSNLVDREPTVGTLLKLLDEQPHKRWSETDLCDLGLDPSTVRRAFKRNFGITFLEMARLRRVQDGAKSLANNPEVIQAQLHAGFESAGGFRTALAKIMGQAPSELSENHPLAAFWINTPIGPMIHVHHGESLLLLEFFDRPALSTELTKLRQTIGAIGIRQSRTSDRLTQELNGYFDGTLQSFTATKSQPGSAFTQSVWQALEQITYGTTVSYSELATSMGIPAATRAVARANGANQIAILIPCHRVLGKDGSLTGYGGGKWRKHWLIEHEQRNR